MNSKLVVLILLVTISGHLFAQKATIREEMVTMKTYMFSDPNPVPEINRIYPYFRFDGYTNHGKSAEWKMVVMENDYIKVFVCPSIGGKVWGAIEKSTGKEFLYHNHVVKFRDVALRGAWTSGGLEYNFGDFGHAPSCSNPVDYKMSENSDGSVSCVVGSIDLPSRTNWSVEIILPKDKAYFETIARWHNNTSLPVSYYHWMNAAAKSTGNLEFIYPGNKRIGHEGEVGDWPVDGGKQISFYDKNNFGTYKSYHVINSYSDFFGGYYHNDDFGFGHYTKYDEKPGRKIWIWGLSEQGMIWKDLLTEDDDQYIEYQAGKLFNQAAAGSTFTPFKHKEFPPHDADVMHEIWFPLKGTKGMKEVSEYAVLNVVRQKDSVELLISGLQDVKSNVMVTSEGLLVLNKEINLKPLELTTLRFHLNSDKNFNVEIDKCNIRYSSENEQSALERPVTPNPEFDWTSAYGLYTKALELEKQRQYPEALVIYLKSLEKEPAFLPSLSRVALEYYRQSDYAKSMEFVLKSLSVDTYDPLGNYVFGLVNAQNGKVPEAKSGFSIASQSVEYRSASYTELARLFLKEKNPATAKIYASKAIAFNAYNVTALEILALANRKENNQDQAMNVLSELFAIDPLNPFIIFEKVKWGTLTENDLRKQITNELPFETYLELALKYYNLDCFEEANEVLNNSPENAEILLWQSFLSSNNRDALLQKALAYSSEFVFPYRAETKAMLAQFMQKRNHWKLKYYSALISWNNGRIDEAKDLFIQCNDEPDFAPFYLAKAKLFAENKNVVKESIEKAMKIDGSDWRVNLALIKYYNANMEFEKSVDIARDFAIKYPEKSVFGMEYAKALMGLGNYEKGILFLEKYNVLPCEGSVDGRNIYYELCIRQAFNELKNKKYKSAINYAMKAKLWPVNLGSGKPYDTDERLEDFIIAYSFGQSNKQDEADKYYKKVMQYNCPADTKENSNLYLQLIAFNKFNQPSTAQNLLSSAMTQEPENEILNWVDAKCYKKDPDLLRDRILNSKNNYTTIEKTYLVNSFRLVLDFLKIIEK
jgi:predicted Zn-dependent protease